MLGEHSPRSFRRSPRHRRQFYRPLLVEALEPKYLLAPIVVDQVEPNCEAGTCFSKAVDMVNKGLADQITFQLTGGEVIHGSYQIRRPVVIDGGGAGNNFVFDGLRGWDGILQLFGGGITVRGLTLRPDPTVNQLGWWGINIRSGGAGGNHIENNRIGFTDDVNPTLDFYARGIGVYESHGDVIEGNVISLPNESQPSRNSLIDSRTQHHSVGIEILGATGTRIQGNKIGTNGAGTVAVGNGVGILIDGGSSIEIGGDVTDATKRNVISGNATGIMLRRYNILDDNPTGVIKNPRIEDVIIGGNFIGTTADGAAELGNGVGVLVTGEAYVCVYPNPQTLCSTVPPVETTREYVITLDNDGDPTTLDAVGTPDSVTGTVIGKKITPAGQIVGDRNVISGNFIGVLIERGATVAHLMGNYIGTDASGLAIVPQQIGIQIGTFDPDVTDSVRTTANFVGFIPGVDDSLRNVISGNQIGVRISGAQTQDNFVLANYIGTNRDGMALLVGPTGERNESNQVGVQIASGASRNLIGAGNVISGNRTAGVQIRDPKTTDNRIWGTYIGTNKDGTARLEDDQSNEFGVVISEGATSNDVGGSTPDQRNVISGNRHEGVRIQDENTSGNHVWGNYIGTDASGTKILNGGKGNEFGVQIDGAGENFIGGLEFGQGNIISGNRSYGILVANRATRNKILGNLIGPDRNGDPLLSGGKLVGNDNGIIIDDSSDNEVGSATNPGGRNVISGNRVFGVIIFGEQAVGNGVVGNYIGTSVDGTKLLPGDFINKVGIIIQDAPSNYIGRTKETKSSFSGNVISGNTDAGILLQGSLSTGNRVEQNLIGLDKSGRQRLKQSNGDPVAYSQSGVSIDFGASGNFIGGPDAGNVVSGFDAGIRIGGASTSSTSNNKILGNYVGTDYSGTSYAGNGVGIRISKAFDNWVGTGIPATRNVIVGSSIAGVQFVGEDTKQNKVLGNYIGIYSDGGAPSVDSARNYSGVHLLNAPENVIGGDNNSVFPNIISANVIGVRIEGASATGNQVLGNLIGTNPLGSPSNSTHARLYGNDFGVVLTDLSGVTFGGTTEGETNLVANNSVGLTIERSQNISVQRNDIEFNDRSGIVVSESMKALIGGASSAFTSSVCDLNCNHISSNGGAGILIQDSQDVSVFGNVIRANGRQQLSVQGNSKRVSIGGSEQDGNYVAGGGRLIGTESGVFIEVGASDVNIDHTRFSDLDLGVRCFGGGSVGFGVPIFVDVEVTVKGCTSVTGVTATAALPTNSTLIEGVATSTPNTTLRLGFFAGDTGPSEYLGEASITTDSQGIAYFQEIVDPTAAVGQVVFVIATGPDGKSSPFSAPVTVTSLPSLDAMAIADVSVAEGNDGTTELEVAIIRRNVSNQTVTVQLDTADGTATEADGDYVPTHGLVVTFPPGVVQQKVTLQVNGDPLIEPDEAFQLLLSNPTGGAVIGDGTAIATILNDDSASVSIGDATVLEPNEGTTSLEFAVSLSNPIGEPLTVEVNSVDGTATVADNDYTSVTGLVLEFLPGGPLTQTVAVEVHGDSTVESDETLNVVLSNPMGANVTLVRAIGEGTILNDVATEISISNASVTESDTGSAAMEFVVSLSAPSDAPVSVEVNTEDGSAVAADRDYRPISGLVLTFEPGGPLNQAVSVEVLSDLTVEHDENLYLALSNPQGVSVAIVDAQGEGLILNDDTTEVTVSGPNVPEGTGGTTDVDFLIRLSKPSAEPITVEYHTEDGTATTADGDYVQVASGTVTIPPGEIEAIVTVAVLADDKGESDEQFAIHVTGATGLGVSNSNFVGIATVLNDDTPGFSVDDVTLAEGDIGLTSFDFTVRLSNPSDRPLSVRIDTVDGTASATNGDYEPISGLVWNYLPGDALTFVVPVSVAADLVTELDEVFHMRLREPAPGSVILDNSAAATIRNDDADGDNDGVSDKLEDLAPGGGDTNGDGLADRNQANVAALPSELDGRYVTLVAPLGISLSGVQSLAHPNLGNSPVGITFPAGFLSFVVNGIVMGGSAEIAIYPPHGTLLDTLYRHGPRSGADPTVGFELFTFDGTTGGETLTDYALVHFQDGSRGDNDVTTDGSIAALVGPAAITGTDLSLAVSTPEVVGQSQPLRYTVSITNNGPNEATEIALDNTLPIGAIVIAAEAFNPSTGTTSEASFDPLCNSLTFQLGQLASGATATAIIDVLAPSAPGIATNIAIVDAANGDLDPANNAVQQDTLVKVVATIGGQKFQDDNGNGLRDSGEIGLNGFTIELVDPADEEIVLTAITRPIDLNGDGIIDAETERGRYEFAVLVDGSYEVREVSLPGFEQTFPVKADDGESAMERVSIDSSGNQGNGTSIDPAISADGRFVAFASEADNLVPDDTNSASDVFVHDRQTGATHRVSVASDGNQANWINSQPAVSADGRFVAFLSSATNLVPDDTNLTSDVFVHDRLTGVTQRVSIDTAGNQANGPSASPAISADGRFVAFLSTATNLAPGDTNGLMDVFVHDRQTGLTERIAIDTASAQGVTRFAISGDGQFVAFAYSAVLIAPDNDIKLGDVFVYDRLTSVVERVTIPSCSDFRCQLTAELPPDLAISATGQFVTFTSLRDNQVPGDMNQLPDVFVLDRQLNRMERVSISTAGIEANGSNRAPAISADGRWVVFDSEATNLGHDSTSGGTFVFDRQTGNVEQITARDISLPGPSRLSISTDGRLIAFDSDATDLVPEDTNNRSDVFVNDRQPVNSDGTHTVDVIVGDRVAGLDFGNAGAFTLDYGDAPESYGTRLSDDGARHRVSSAFLGIAIEPDDDGQPAALATGDDADGIDDEDGVLIPELLIQGDTANVIVHVATESRLDAWIDFDGNGRFDHPAEQIAASQMLDPGEHEISFLVPAVATVGQTYARFRASTAGGLAPTGEAPDGEVEDYPVRVVAPADLTVSIAVERDPIIAISPLFFVSGTPFLPPISVPDSLADHTITVINSGPGAAEQAMLTIDLPPGVLPLDVLDNESCELTGNRLTCALGTLDLGQTWQLRLLSAIDFSTLDTVVVEARAASATPDLNLANNVDVGQATIDKRANLSIALSGDSDPVVPGQQLTYTAVVTNRGPYDARDVAVTTELPPGVTLVSTVGCEDPSGLPTCALGVLAGGRSKQFSVTVSVDLNARGTLTASARVESTTTEAKPGDEQASVETVVLAPPNSPPTADASGPYTVAEGGAVLLDGSRSSDPDQSSESLNYEWDLDGDGFFGETGVDAQRGDETGVAPTFSAAGLDGPSSVTVRLRITDDGELTDEASAEIGIQNVAPVIESLTTSSPACGGGAEGDEVIVLLSFTDAGTLDTHDVVFDWGDGTSTTVSVGDAGGLGVVSGTHAYSQGGEFTVTLTLTDDDTASVQRTTTTIIAGVGIHDGTLFVIGTDRTDHVTINKPGRGLLKIETDLLPARRGGRVFDLADVERIHVMLCDGDDHATIAGKITTSVTMDGGPGDDHLHGGDGDDILHGGPGNDHLHGGPGDDYLFGDEGDDHLHGDQGDDVLSGGDGEDKLHGGLGDDLLIGGRDADDIHGDEGLDILIGGYTIYDNNIAALDALLGKWKGTPSDYVSRVQRVCADTGSINDDPFLLGGVTVFDDQSADKLTGGSRRDLFFADLDGEDDDDDLVSDRKTKKDEEFLFDLAEPLP